MIYQKLTNFHGFKMVTHQNLTQLLNHLNLQVPHVCSVLSTRLPCFKQRSARDPGLGSTIQSPKGPEDEKKTRDETDATDETESYEDIQGFEHLKVAINFNGILKWR